jgi:NDP-sugar pyrophosphorylase family protein
MKAMLLAAGQGTRLRPLTERIPKCMVPVSGKPILEHTIQWLHRYGVSEIIINLYHLPEIIRAYFGDGQKWGVRITYSLEDSPLGTAGGVRNAAWFFEGPFFVWYGDNLSTCRLDCLWEFHQAKGGIATIALHYRDDPAASGIVGLDKDDRITRFLEKPRPDQVFSHWVSAGIFVLEPQVSEAIPAEGSPDFGRDVFPALLAHGQPLYGYRMSEGEGLWWIDTPEDLRRMEEGKWKMEKAK